MTDYFSFVEKLFDPSRVNEKPEALKGVRVLDFCHVIFGPHTAMLLALWGAEVIKIEQTHSGDGFRGATLWGKYVKHSSPFFHFINRNKYFITLDLKEPKAKEIIYKLVEKSDVVIENFAPGTMHAWGLGYLQLSQINPRIIYLSESTYGQYGPMRFYPGFDILAQAACGMAATTGFPGTDKYFKLPDYLGDFIPAHIGALAVLIALYYREKTGRGQYIDLSQCESLIRMMPHFTYLSVAGKELERTGGVDPSMAPSGIFKSSDGKFVAIAIATDQHFKALCKAMEREDILKDERFKGVLERLKPENADYLNKILQTWVSSETAAEIIIKSKKYGFPAAEVLDEVQIANEEWRRKRGSVTVFEDAMYGKFVMPGPPFRMSETPGRTKWLSRPVGYHNRYILSELLNMSEDEISILEKEGIITYWDQRPGCMPPAYYDMGKDPIFNYRKGGWAKNE
jgi:crotonobetainyl-CoA:carnitine CoA-transferase CaiB-like acyl-CoA transferase